MAVRCVAPAPPMRRSRPGALARRPSSASPLLSGRGSSSKPCAPVRAQYKRGMTLGEWCDENGEYGDKLMEEWYDPDRTVDGVTRGNNIYRALWRCSAGCTKDGEKFTWEALVSGRTGPNRNGCPGCAGKVPTDAHNLLRWCEDNGEWGQRLIEEWAEPDVDMKDVTPGTEKKLLWRCSAGCTVDGEPFTWEATGKDRTGHNRTGCRGCVGRGPYVQLTDQNNLLKWCQDNGEYGQKLIEEWAEPDVNMKDMLHGTKKKTTWRCSTGCMEDGQSFTWETQVSDRTSSDRHGCPGCSPAAPIDLKKRLGKIAR
jgi:hypothetical protein